MNQPPLNPDALEEASNAVRRITLGEVNSWDVAEAAITAYLAVAQPVVATVDELNALPCASVVLNGVTAFQKYGAREPFDWSADGRWYDSTQVELPARVLYLPTKESTNGR